jgi:lipopolysaccharide biosynthesis glycosyltransferase
VTTLHVACQARTDYVPHSAAMLHSVLTAGGCDDVTVHFLHGADVGPDQRDPLRAMVERLGGRIEFTAVDPQRLEGLATNAQFPAAHWYRLFLPELLPEVDRVLYLDGDLIVVDSLRPLWELDLEGHLLAAVTNVFQADHFGRIPMLGLDAPDDYFNSGVMLLDLEAMRRESTTEAVLGWALEHHDQLDWPEQDALNVVIGHRRLPLPPRWNLMYSVLRFPWAMQAFGARALAEATARPAIRHFEGPGSNKPWHYLAERDARELYARHRAHTPWPTFRPEGRTAANVLRRVVRSARARVRP